MCVTYLDMCLAFLKRVLSSIRHALPVVTWPARVGSNLALAPQKTGPTAASVSPEPTVAEDTVALAAAHLEYLGYTVRLDPEGWSYAQHPYRGDFHLRKFPEGIRLHGIVGIGAAIGNSRIAWLEFLNDANDRGQIAQFSLVEDTMGRHAVRMWTFVSGAYSRLTFSVVMDMWHNDLELVRQKPAFCQESVAGEDEHVAVTVH